MKRHAVDVALRRMTKVIKYFSHCSSASVTHYIFLRLLNHDDLFAHGPLSMIKNLQNFFLIQISRLDLTSHPLFPIFEISKFKSTLALDFSIVRFTTRNYLEIVTDSEKANRYELHNSSTFNDLHLHKLKNKCVLYTPVQVKV